MRYEGTRPSKADSKVNVFIFTLGRKEVELMLALAEQAHAATPNHPDIQPYKNRLRNMKKNLFGALQGEDRSR